jgi:hypothetical protein
MQHLEVSCAVRPIYGSLGAKGIRVELPGDAADHFPCRVTIENEHSYTATALHDLMPSTWTS